MKQLAVVGAGSWGTALAIALASRCQTIRQWARDGEQASRIMQSRQNAKYLPGFQLPENVYVSADLCEVVSGANTVLLAVPSAHMRVTTEALRPFAESDALFVSASKGIEGKTLCRMSEVLCDTLGEPAAQRVAVLSGPTFAREVAAGEPAALVVSSQNCRIAQEIQQGFSTPTLRLYSSSDVVGVEIGAALKNVVAIGAGVCRGLGLGSNSVAALVTRGLAEIMRLAVAMGANPGTLSGLAGLGDLVLTATGDLSRNRFVGIQLGQGRQLSAILKEMSMIAEGVSTCHAARQLGLNHQVDLPIVNRMYEILYEGKDPSEAIRELMDRPLTIE